MDLAEKILNGWSITKPQRKFLLRLFLTILSLHGKVNFRNLSRYSGVSVRTFARQFDQAFDFIRLNRALIDQVVVADRPRLIAFDPCFLPKAGKHTPELAYFWNGCHGRAEKGLEVSCFSLIDALLQNLDFLAKHVYLFIRLRSNTKGRKDQQGRQG